MESIGPVPVGAGARRHPARLGRRVDSDAELLRRDPDDVHGRPPNDSAVVSN